MNNFKMKHVSRGYPNWTLNRARRIAASKDTNELSNKHSNEKQFQKPNVPLISLQYSPQFYKIKNIILKYLPLLYDDKKLEHILSVLLLLQQNLFPTVRAPKFITQNSISLAIGIMLSM
ncbi:hypothetical protein GDO81_010491 [Engystomops pustulosus]|uniref:Uncharacterized protein n=1 Tax=Engystomops pustulosus TaxID=76066 RepID=A0AAV7C166_ENGPU|nr:hypothetical protein GDO81_010491 [Engystomops pustulosus]